MNLSTQVAVVASLLALALGVLVWTRSERTQTTLPFSLLCISFFVFCSGKILFLLFGRELFGQLASVGGLFTLASFYFLMVVYRAAQRRMLEVSVVVVVALAAAASVLRFVLHSGLAPARLSVLSLIASGAITAIALLGIGVQALSEAPGRQRRTQVSLMAMLLLAFGIYLLEKTLRPLAPIQPWTLLVLCLFLYFLYLTVVRYADFGLRELVGKGSVLAVSTAFLAIVYGLLVYLIGATPVQFAFHTVVAAFLLLVLYEPVLTRIEAGTLRWMFRGGRQQRGRMGALARDLAGRISADEVLDFLGEAVPQKLGFATSRVYLLDSNRFARTGMDETGPPFFESAMLEGKLMAATSPLSASQVRRQAFDSYPGEDRDQLLALGEIFGRLSAAVILPLRHPDALLGFWAIDPGGGPEMDPETAEVLLSLADQASLRIENARIYEKLMIRDRLAMVGEMAAGLAHEIRNPLGSMKGAAEYIKDEPLPATAQEFVQIILEEAGRLNEVLSRFLDFARPFKVDLVRTDLVGIVEKTLAMMRADEFVSGIVFERSFPEAPVFCMMDGKLIQQVVINLVKNGIEAMLGEGRVAIAVRQDSDTVSLLVIDHGTGVPPERVSKVFEPFFTTKTGGSGLGLAISQRIAEAHGGRLTMQSMPGEGATFELILPIDGPRPSSQESQG